MDASLSKDRSVDPFSVWKHYKGAHYIVLAVAYHTEEQYNLVVYKELNTDFMWARPLTMFLEQLEDGRYRFERKV